MDFTSRASASGAIGGRGATGMNGVNDANDARSPTGARGAADAAGTDGAVNAMNADGAMAVLRRALDGGVLRDIDYQLMVAAMRLRGVRAGANPHGALALALASAALARGHVCVELDNLATALPPHAAAALPDGFSKLAKNTAARAEMLRGWEALLAPAPRAPFVADGSRVYLRRYFDYERDIAERLRAFAAAPPRLAPPRALAALKRFSLNKGQHDAARVALERSFVLITGGPGTGKTHVLARILQLLAIAADEAAEPPPQILLAAPTGKAAARMDESIRAAATANAANAGAFSAIEAAAATPSAAAASTIEQLLGYIPDSPYFRHDAANPLAADVVVVDEASMLDLAKTAKLLAALPSGARLILLGDPHQLAAVEPGSVLGEMCAAPALAPCVARLDESRRFPPESLVGRLSAAINRAKTRDDARAAFEIAKPILRAPDDGDAGLLRAVREGYDPLLAARTLAEAFAALGKFRVLCATREGARGVAEMNRLAERALGLRTRDSGAFYLRRVVMVTRNDYSIRLYNGDIGIVLPDTAEADGIAPFDAAAARNAASTDVVWFPAAARADGRTAASAFRPIPVHLLPEHETAFAITIHKSQGSEFDAVLACFPDKPSPVLCKELLYTAITRSRETVALCCPEAIFEKTLLQSIQRFSGLAARLA